MKIKLTPALVFIFLCPFAWAQQFQQQGRIISFSPQGTVKQIRQAHARFSDPMVPFGEPRTVEAPFKIGCSEKGTGRWADSYNWIYDFDRDLPAGVRCEFRTAEGLKTLAGGGIAGQRSFVFSTGGPSITGSIPYEGSQRIDEEQIFILELDGDPTEASVLEHVAFIVEGIEERVGNRIVGGSEKEAILKAQYRYRSSPPPHLLLIQSKQRFPAGSRVSLVWGKGVASNSGVATEEDQILRFETRTPFTATFHCQRENPQADCTPISPMRIQFSERVLWADAKKAILKASDGKQWSPQNPGSDDIDEGKYVYDIVFAAPFPERSAFTIQIPAGIEDDANRSLSNAANYPITVKTDEYPPLAKFASDFGILELNANPLLPVTLRNVEANVPARILEVQDGEGYADPIVGKPGTRNIEGNVQGRIYKVPTDKAGQMLSWIRKIRRRSWEDRGKSILGPVSMKNAEKFSIPKPQGSKAFEVVGIPIKSSGFYVVEMESEILGSALLGKAKPMYVPTAVLVTNLAVHFKWGNEASLVWVTTLDKGKPVENAAVKIMDCEGTVRWEAKSDRSGIARVAELPEAETLPRCSYEQLGGGLLVTAQLGNDMAFAHSDWNDGIEPWRFQLPREWTPIPITVHTIFDRTLFRAGETVHMKHVLRREVTSGFALEPESKSPRKAIIEHLGSQQKFEFPLKWEANGIAESTWTIPQEAKLGQYQVSLLREEPLYSGVFRVEEFRTPLMRATIRPPSTPMVLPSTVPVDLTVNYLAGGGAGNLPVKFRYEIQQRYTGELEGFEGFTFSNGKVKEGLTRGDLEETSPAAESMALKSMDLTLNAAGSVQTKITDLPKIEKPVDIHAELEYRDPNGEIQTVSSKIPIWSASRQIGIRPDSWALSKESLKFQVAVVDLSGKPVADAPVKVDLFQRKTYSHRKRLVGGFYAYEHSTEIKRLGTECEGKTDRKGILICVKPSSISGSVILEATTRDDAGRETSANQEVWIAGQGEWWFANQDDDRIDVLAEKKRYEPGEKAKLQVRMPFRKATALITVEREGVAEAFLRELSGKEPVVEIPVKGDYAPNIFVSVLVVRGRISEAQPTATVDLGRPAYKLGIAEINVGWKTHELKVKVAADKPVYKTREKAKVAISVSTADGTPLPAGSEAAIAAVDAGLLELMPNDSWKLLDTMMGRRSYGVETSTAQMHVIGKRHFGLKALPQGGGGGRQNTRELFDTLLLWKGRVKIDAKGQAIVEIPLNDSITSFQIVAVVTAGVDRFGTGSTSIRSTQDLSIISGIAPVARSGDKIRSEFTLHNMSERALEAQVTASIKGIAESLAPQTLSLAAGQSKDIGWTLTVPAGIDSLQYELAAKSGEEITDRLRVNQKVVPAVPQRVFQATLSQIEGDYRLEVERPADAIPGQGGIHVTLRPSLLAGLVGVTDYMNSYPYTCLEQLVSKAIVLKDVTRWDALMEQLPSYLDSDGLVKYFPQMRSGSDVLTAYLIAISHEAGLEIPDTLKQRLLRGLRDFVEGRIVRYSSLPTADLSIRKLAAIEALTRVETIAPALLSSIDIKPNLWPTSAVIDWINVLQRTPAIRDRDSNMKEADQILRTRLNFQGTVMSFSTDKSDYLWWLMVSCDSNAARLLLSRLDSPAWNGDISRIVRGILARQNSGHWATTTANAWGVVAMEKFSNSFEKTPVSGLTTASLAGKSESLDWNETAKGKTIAFPWPRMQSPLAIEMKGTGKPWVTIQSIAAIPLKEPFSSGFRIKKTITAIGQAEKSKWSKGDIVRVKLELEAQSDVTWVVVNDPIPAGATILGTNLGRDSILATKDEKNEGWVWPAFEERSFETFRAYYEYVPKGAWTIEYTLRLNSEGVFNLPPTRVEAMYAPEMLGELPNQQIQVN
ncbi:MAG: alpha-2-macroglobulin domain protein 2 [Acidobacteria bacterium]|nr:alpha-2-macroglobulin domain protein 2 [Acidobacteriota bacterium]